ncbi:putative ATPase family AAA domain-containing protein 1 [Glonium stellatum]|uniref:Putative ATPase family AAA domain-containing protein 1 n=1 Tax=Glonium stellatum TaxID=574774 RepID=A0A8E2F619_9PEZI|nr:putative ATPase family AAA domain-containing protein 1 [Glonium stellatum]
MPKVDYTPDADERLELLRMECQGYEKALLDAIIHPGQVNKTFADVHAPTSTMEAFKDLTMSLIRPDAFKYGILARKKLSGILIYGLPGTGKTLLVKALAKSAQFTVIGVSSAEIQQMYVGESEKCIKAAFSLAHKLKPCIIFIDEADALLKARKSDSHSYHISQVSQFLHEWDGISSNDERPVVIAATSRPFDLDDAVLRRLPQRLLVDVPEATDREAILKIHLHDEVLDPDVDISALANITPSYTGSDLENLCVSAALACVREEIDSADNARANTSYSETQGLKETTDVYPPQRVLQMKHFNIAKGQISMSIDTEMHHKIKAFHAKYGNKAKNRYLGSCKSS